MLKTFCTHNSCTDRSRSVSLIIVRMPIDQIVKSIDVPIDFYFLRRTSILTTQEFFGEFSFHSLSESPVRNLEEFCDIPFKLAIFPKLEVLWEILVYSPM